MSHYAVHESLGSGGMGVVYRATDTVLGRVVALKFPAAQYARDALAMARLFREAQTASALDHPNIGTVYEVGDHEGQLFIAMAFYEGESLQQRLARGPLPLDEAVSVGEQLASALASAHAAGIVHRDLKPANVMVLPGGLIKLVDFGLAKLVADSEPEPSLSGEGALLGTVAYMSPEQALAHPVDGRTDLWSLGVVLYEMLTARPPFRSETKVATLARILHETPTPVRELRPQIPPALAALVDTLLAKDPEVRLSDAGQVLERLRGFAREGPNGADTLAEPRRAVRFHRKVLFAALLFVFALLAAPILLSYRSKVAPEQTISPIAVLPFTQLDATADSEYLGDSLSSEIIEALSKLPKLKVISRSASARYTGPGQDPREIGRALGVRALLMGTLRRRGEMLRIEIELVDTANGRHLWGQTTEHPLSQISLIRESIVASLVEPLHIELLPREKQANRRSTVDPEAYRLFLQGRYYLNSRLNADKGREYFERAIEQDPTYARAYAGLADSYASPVGVRALLPPDLAGRRARAAALRAIEMDGTLADAYVALGNASLTYEWDLQGAEESYLRAIALDPRDSNARHRYSHLLIAMGRFDESLVQSLRAIESDPLDPNLIAHLGFHYKTARQPERAIDTCLQAIKLNPNARVGYFYLAEAYAQKGRFGDALALLDGIPPKLKAEIAATPGVTGFGHVYAVSGRPEEARRAIEDLLGVAKSKTNASYRLARNYAALGEIDAAFQWLEQAYVDRAPALMDVKVDPVLDPVRTDPRYFALLTRMGLAP